MCSPSIGPRVVGGSSPCEAKRRGRAADDSEGGVLVLDDVPSRDRLGIVERGLHVVDGPARHAVQGHLREPLGRRAAAKDLLEHRDEHVPVAVAPGEVGEALVARQLGRTDRVAEALPELLLRARDHDPPVRRRERLEGHHRLMGGVRHPPRLEVLGRPPRSPM